MKDKRSFKAAGACALLLAAACSPIDPPPAHWGDAQVMLCGERAVRVHPEHGFQVDGIRLSGDEVAWLAEDTVRTAAWRQWTAGFTEGRHGFRLNDERYALRMDPEGGPVLSVALERRPATPNEAQLLSAQAYDEATAAAPPAPARHPLSPWHGEGAFAVTAHACQAEAVSRGRFGDLTWADLAAYLLLEWAAEG